MLDQRGLFSPKQPEGRIVLAVETNIVPFGNRTDMIVVDGSTVRGMSLLEVSSGVILVDGQGIISRSEDDTL